MGIIEVWYVTVMKALCIYMYHVVRSGSYIRHTADIISRL